MPPEKSPSFQDLLAEAADPTTPAPRLERIAAEQPIAALVAAYPDMPRDHLPEGDEASRIVLAQALAGNPNLPLATLLTLARYFPARFFANPIFSLLFLENPNWPIRLSAATAEALLRDATAPASFVSQLRDHPDPAVRQAAQWHVQLAGERGADWAEQVRDALRQRRFPTVDSPPYRQIPFGVFLRSGMLPLWLLTALVGHEQSQIRALALVNPDLPAELHEVAAATPIGDRHPSYLHARAMWLRQYALKVTPRPDHDAAQDFYVSPQTLAQLAQRPEWLTRRYVALNPTTPLDVLTLLANDTVPEVAEAVTLHPSATPTLIWHIYRRLVTGDIPTRNAFYRMVAFASPFLTPRQLAAHIGASDWVERLAIARNPRTPASALLALTNDGNTLVRAAARALLRARLVLTLAQRTPID